MKSLKASSSIYLTNAAVTKCTEAFDILREMLAEKCLELGEGKDGFKPPF